MLASVFLLIFSFIVALFFPTLHPYVIQYIDILCTYTVCIFLFLSSARIISPRRRPSQINSCQTAELCLFWSWYPSAVRTWKFSNLVFQLIQLVSGAFHCFVPFMIPRFRLFSCHFFCSFDSKVLFAFQICLNVALVNISDLFDYSIRLVSSRNWGSIWLLGSA